MRFLVLLTILFVSATQAASTDRFKSFLRTTQTARGTFEQNKLRATAVMDSLHALKGSLGAS